MIEAVDAYAADRKHTMKDMEEGLPAHGGHGEFVSFGKILAPCRGRLAFGRPVTLSRFPQESPSPCSPWAGSFPPCPSWCAFGGAVTRGSTRLALAPCRSAVHEP